MKLKIIRLKKKTVIVSLIFLSSINYGWTQSPVLKVFNRFGGSSSDRITAMIVDETGNVFITGSTNSPGLATSGAYQQTIKGAGFTGGDAFLAKLDGTTLNPLWVTYLGGNSSENGTDESGGLAFGPSGSIIVVGTTASRDFPTTPNALKNSNTGEGEDLFISIISSDGRQLIYSSYLGGSQPELLTAFRNDSNGDLYIAGITRSTNFPVTSNGFQTTYPGGLDSGFLLRMSNDGTTIKFGTYLGGSESDKLKAICVISSDEVWIGGSSSSSNFPVTQDAFDKTMRGCGSIYCDAFLANMNTNSGTLTYSTYFGGKDGDEISAIEKSGTNELFLIGSTSSVDFPVTNWAVVNQNITPDGFVIRFLTDCKELGFSSLIGGNRAGEQLRAVSVTQSNLILVGRTFSGDFPVTSDAIQSSIKSRLYNGFVIKIQQIGRKILYSTILGGYGWDETKFIVQQPSNILAGSGTVIFIAGESFSESISSKIYQNDPGSRGNRDIFITRWIDDRVINPSISH